MLRPKISVELEKTIRAAAKSGLGRTAALEKVVQALDEAQSELRSSIINRHKPGMPYKDILFHFKKAFGDELALPPDPNTTWVIRLVTRVKELGLNAEAIAKLRVGAKKLYPKGPYDIDFLIRSATRILHAAETPEAVSESTQVFTGRSGHEE